MSRQGIDHRHCKWPLGTEVFVLTPQGYKRGKIHRHPRDYRHGADVSFNECVDFGNLNGNRFCHPIPFRSMRRVNPEAPRLKSPWYRKAHE